MRIGIDTFGLEHGQSGFGKYLMSFLDCMKDDPDVEVVLFGPEKDRYVYNRKKNYEYIPVNLKESLWAERNWHRFCADSFARRNRLDAVVYVAGARLIPSSFRVPSVAVVNEIASTGLSTIGNFFDRLQVRKGLSKADCIIVPGMFVKKDLARCGIKCRRVEIVHNGIDHSEFFQDPLSAESDTVQINPFAIKKPYLLYASSIKGPEKKHIELIRAFGRFKEKTGLAHRLVLAGSIEENFSKEVAKAAFESPYASDIFITGYFPQEGLPELYRNSDGCIFPSINEGVGLPVLEAMASGIPVACTKAGVLQEISGGNALYFNSDDIEGMSLCMEQLVTDEKIRGQLIENAAHWSERFSWEKTASETLEIVKGIVKGN